MRKNLWSNFRKAASALSGPFPPLKGNVVVSAANSWLQNYICAASSGTI